MQTRGQRERFSSSVMVELTIGQNSGIGEQDFSLFSGETETGIQANWHSKRWWWRMFFNIQERRWFGNSKKGIEAVVSKRFQILIFTLIVIAAAIAVVDHLLEFVKKVNARRCGL